jgi:Mg-chelatase subunit ChlD
MRLHSLAFAVPAVLVLVACGSEPAPAPEDVPLPARAPAASPSKDGFGPAADGNGKDDGSVLGSCAESATPVKREPASVMLLIDRSGSMHIKLPSGDSRWQATKKGLFDLFAVLPEATQVGAMMFPQGDAPVNAYCRIDAALNDVKCNAGWPEPPEAARCSSATYKAGVGSSLLAPSQVEAIKAHVTASDTEFYWGTPLAPALAAAISSQKAPSIKGARSVILLTDGNPTSCEASGISNDISHVVDAAAAGTRDTPVRTFVIGVIDDARQAARPENLSPVAVAGGTARAPGCEADNSCFYPVAAASFATDIKKVFEDISLQAFDCTFPVPEPKAGATADPSTLNVEVTNNGSGYIVPRDVSRQNGWDYLPGGKQLQVYGEACKKLAGDAVNVKVVVGCKTQVR